MDTFADAQYDFNNTNNSLYIYNSLYKKKYQFHPPVAEDGPVKKYLKSITWRW